MRLIFENPHYVSATAEKDVLVINLSEFKDQDGNLIADSLVLKRDLPN